jgi:hypothetical protein
MSMTSVFGHNNTVMWYKRIFDDANITDITNTWPLFKAYMLSQHKNIAKGDGLKQADIYPQANAAAAPSCPSVDDQVNQAMAANRISPAATYTAADLEEITVRAVRAALDQHARAAVPPPPQTGRNARTVSGRKQHCNFHGPCAHSGNECTAIVDGQPCTHRTRDSRYTVYDASRVYGHVGCTHNPRCISAADARTAVGPNSFPTMPGNNFK